MTKTQKKLFKSLKKKEFQDAFVDMLVAQQASMGKYDHWAPAYAKKLRKKGEKPRQGLGLPKA